MELKDYQNIAVDKLVSTCKRLLELSGSRICVLKAPTGSGKTIMVAEYLKQLSGEQLPTRYAFLWISGNKLHEQSRSKLEQYLQTSRYTFSFLEEIQNSEFVENEIVFVNWHSLTKQDKTTGAYTNIFMRDNEEDKNLPAFIRNSKDNGLQIVLIVDESHYHYWSPKSQELVQTVIAPKLTIEVSATPQLSLEAEDIANGEAGFVSVQFDKVVAEGMIKSEVIVNKGIGKYTIFDDAADEIILSAALAKQRELVRDYKLIGREAIRPLVLVQLPSKTEKTSALDIEKLEKVISILRKNQITTDNGKLGIWLSERKENLERVTSNRSDVQVLIFKQAIALGWDCPRAQILVMFREIQSTTFEIQTVGRIMRMPEARHYDNDELNRAFVYTNLPRVKIASDKDSQTYYIVKSAHRRTNYRNLRLQSAYLSRVSYGDLTLSFRKLFFEEADKYFDLKTSDSVEAARDKVAKVLHLKPNELKEPIIADAVIKNIDNIPELVGKTVTFNVHEDDLKYKYEYFAKCLSLPYAPVRSHTKIQQAIYDWFDRLGYKYESRLTIQRIIVCSENNQRVFGDIIMNAKGRFKEVCRKEIAAKQTKKDILWEVPAVDYFNEYFEKQSCNKYILEPCYLHSQRSDPEKEFELFLDKKGKNNRIKWWYHNGVGREDYFALPYINPEDGLVHSFYPDYIVCFSDNSIGIFDTKSGYTAEIKETAAKSNALQAYIAEQAKAKRNIVGGITVFKQSVPYYFTGLVYTNDLSDDNWKPI